MKIKIFAFKKLVGSSLPWHPGIKLSYPRRKALDITARAFYIYAALLYLHRTCIYLHSFLPPSFHKR